MSGRWLASPRLLASVAACTIGWSEASTLVHAQEGMQGICFAAEFDRENGPIRSMTAQVKPSGDEQGEPYTLFLSFTEWDVPNEIFDTTAGCHMTNGVLRCGIECDGGNATAVVGSDKRLLLQTSGLSFGATGDDVLLSVTADADGGQLTGIYALKGTASAECRPKAQHVFSALEIGDISPRVQAAETMLNKTGQLLEFPDTIFDEKTEIAVRAFQHQYGIPETGRIDEQTAVLLARSDGVLGGGC